MKTEEIKDLFAQFESIVCDYNGVECWSARELYKLLGYVQWRNFLAIVDKAKTACENAGMKVADHFADVSKTIAMPKGAEREVDKLLKRKLNAPDNRPLADFLPTISIKAKDLAAEMTSVNVQTKDLYGQKPIEQEHIDNNTAPTSDGLSPEADFPCQNPFSYPLQLPVRTILACLRLQRYESNLKYNAEKDLFLSQMHFLTCLKTNTLLRMQVFSHLSFLLLVAY